MASTLDPKTLSRRDLLDLAEAIMEEARQARDKPRGYVRRGQEGTIRDPAVKMLAAIALNRMRREGVSLESIGKLLGVSRERVRQLEEKLLGEFEDVVEDRQQMKA